MAGHPATVFGIYPTATRAESAVDRISAARFSHNHISVLVPIISSENAFPHTSGTQVLEGTKLGATSGGVVGGTLGLLAGFGAFAIPGLGPIIAAGPILASLAGMGFGGAVGGLIGALAAMGIPEHQAKHYEGQVKAGGVLLSVHCRTSQEITRAKALLKWTGAEAISSARANAAGSTRLFDPAAISGV